MRQVHQKLRSLIRDLDECYYIYRKIPPLAKRIKLKGVVTPDFSVLQHSSPILEYKDISLEVTSNREV